jgi:hypothetical protein
MTCLVFFTKGYLQQLKNELVEEIRETLSSQTDCVK